MAPFSRSIPLGGASKIAVLGNNRSCHYARHWLGLLGCAPKSSPCADGIVIVDGEAGPQDPFPDGVSVVRLWDFQVGFAGNGHLASAVSGAAAVIGYPGQPGVSLPADMPEKWCAAYGVILALAELWQRSLGVRQTATEYDVSSADVLRAFSLQNSGDAAERARTWRRNGRVCVEHGGIFPMGFFACQDGYVALLGRSRRDWRHIRKAIGDPDWTQEPAFEDPFAIAKDSAEADRLLEETLRQFGRDELLQRGLAEGAVIAPVYSAAEAAARDIFRDRFFVDSEPSMPFTIDTLGASDTAATPDRVFDAEDGPLAGLRCLELCWVWSGPMVCQILADLGAEVIKVETPKRFDLYRTRGLETQRGLMDERTRIESSIYFHSLNRNKVGLSLDLKQEEGLSIAKSLIGDSDLVIENFTVGTMERLGLSRDVLSEANSRIVQLSMSGPGRGSAVEELRSYGLVLSALGGAEILIEEEGQFLGSPTFSLSDPNAAVFGAMAAIAGALSARENGRGMAIDLSQIEAAATLVTAPVPPSSTRDAMVETADGAIVATSVPNDSPAEALDFAGMTREQLVRNCEIVGGQTAVFRELDQSEDATEFADCFAWLPSHHSYTGDEMLVAAPWRESGARADVRKPAPLLGEGDRYVLGDLLSFSEAEIVRLTESGIVGVPDLAQPAPPKRKKANA